MQSRKLLFMMMSLLLSISTALTQDLCETVVADALSATNSACAGTSRNEACYGNVQISPELADTDLVFTQKGDIVQLTEIERLTLSPYDEETNAWGVALLNVQANIPDTVPGQGVMFLLFGDVDIANDGDAMEAFYFSSGVGTSDCNEAESGILINTPEGVGTVSLIANDVTIELGSTALLTAIPDDLMTIALTEGNASVTSEGVTQEFEGGFQVTVPINEDLEAVGAPSEPEPIPEETTENLPDINEFVDDENDDSGDDNDDSGDTVAGGIIVPLSGNWGFTLDALSASDGCPAGLGEMMTAQPIPPSYVEFGDTFDLQAMMENSVDGGLPASTVYSNPEPNVYTMEFVQEGVPLYWEMTLVSEALMTGEYFADLSSLGMDCQISINYSVTLED